MGIAFGSAINRRTLLKASLVAGGAVVVRPARGWGAAAGLRHTRNSLQLRVAAYGGNRRAPN